MHALILQTLLYASCLLGCVVSAQAETASGKFTVFINLNGVTDSGICTSQSQADATGGLIKVSCKPELFVNIQASAGQASTFSLGSQSTLAAAANATAVPKAGTVAALGMIPAATTNSGAGSTMLVDMGKTQKISEVQYVDATTGTPVNAPSRFDTQTSSVTVYKDLYSRQGNETTRRVNTDTIPQVPVEMLIVF